MNQLVAWSKNNPLALALGVVAIIAAVYYFGGKTIKAVADVAGGAVSGNNLVTQNQTTWDGQKETAYEGKGVLGTVGAAANSASGGALASVGEAVGGWWYNLLNSDSSTAN